MMVEGGHNRTKLLEGRFAAVLGHEYEFVRRQVVLRVSNAGAVLSKWAGFLRVWLVVALGQSGIEVMN